MQLGNSATSTYAYNTVQTRSDARDKIDVEDTDLGLAFVEDLRPVRFRNGFREDYIEDDGTVLPPDGSRAGKRFHQGLIAQDVKATMDRLGVDFGGYQDHTVCGGGDVLTLGYTEFVGPLIKAVQELSARVREVEGKGG